MDHAHVENLDRSVRESGVLSLSDERWATARRREEIIAPLARQDQVTTSQAVEAAKHLGVSRATIYLLIQKLPIPAKAGT